MGLLKNTPSPWPSPARGEGIKICPKIRETIAASEKMDSVKGMRKNIRTYPEKNEADKRTYPEKNEADKRTYPEKNEAENRTYLVSGEKRLADEM